MVMASPTENLARHLRIEHPGLTVDEALASWVDEPDPLVFAALSYLSRGVANVNDRKVFTSFVAAALERAVSPDDMWGQVAAGAVAVAQMLVFDGAPWPDYSSFNWPPVDDHVALSRLTNASLAVAATAGRTRSSRARRDDVPKWLATQPFPVWCGAIVGLCALGKVGVVSVDMVADALTVSR